MNKDVRHLLKALRKQGFEVVETTRHYEIRLNGARITTVARTPSDHRSLRNAIAPCKRAGFVWPLRQ